MRKPIFKFKRDLTLTYPKKPTIGELLMALSTYQRRVIESSQNRRWSEHKDHVKTLYQEFERMGLADKINWCDWPVR